MAYQTENTPADPRHSSRLNLRQRFYVVEVLVGLALTAQHFFGNMLRNKATKCGGSIRQAAPWTSPL